MTPAGPHRWRILVVDDEIGPRESLRMLLTPAHDIRTADSARAALKEIDGFHPDLVILDIKMPHVDGLETLRRIKRIDPAIEVVMITAYASLETVKQALSDGAFEYLIKPFARQDLEDVVGRALGRRQSGLGVRTEVATLVEQMRSLVAKTRQLEQTSRREAAEQALRATQLSLLREFGRTIVRHLDLPQITATVVEQLRQALGFDQVLISLDGGAPPADGDERLARCTIRDADGPLGHLVVDNRPAGRPIDARERELLEMLSEFLAVAVRNSCLYGDVASTTQRLAQLIACAGDAIVTVDVADRIRGWNPAAERILALSATDALGSHATRVLPEQHYVEGKRRLVEGAPTHAFDVSGVAIGDRVIDVAVTLSALRDGQGAPEGLIAIVRDVTSQREMENQLRQSEKLTALGQLAGGIAHDFNNLLQAILGYTQLMRQNPADVGLIERSLQIVESAALHGAETVRRIQQFARLRPDEALVAVNLNQVLEEALAITRLRWEQTATQENRPLRLRSELGVIPLISGRPAALTEAVTNLILNAIDAMPTGGTLSIRTDRTPSGDVLATVADTGVGMPEAVRRRVFEPFFSTKGEGGSGLGLAMAYSIVKRHGGDIHVESTPGRGTVFTLTFSPGSPTTPAPVAHVTSGERRHARILVVDDDPHVLATLTGLLESLGHATAAATSASTALDACARDRFDVVVTDIGMPGMNGWDLAERLHVMAPGVALVFVTGWGLTEADVARLDALGVRHWLIKPVQSQELDGAIQNILSGA